jgi:hypothetical protein
MNRPSALLTAARAAGRSPGLTALGIAEAACSVMRMLDCAGRYT